ncbi:alpha-amylase family protein [Paractinoplanes lichenicola]|uniref:Alpha-amylase n=1 Tax=Paractinoplanes lichenicola TaxID=2802976 RepID=A0ABS1W0N5_9ACTN|nr:alpha-amylase family protein [Actinoplanes lichenicola]MBL7260274.1 alpha-amylase family protein [Actinoplanes lichenicola]
MAERWYRNGVIYNLDVRAFQDSNGDGVGDLRGLISRIDYLGRLGVTTLWLSPLHPSPWRDGGYDVSDHYNIDPALGSLGDFAELMNVADERGLRIMLDLVLNHTSDEHPWFTSARTDPRSAHRDWYVWSDQEPPDRDEGMVFPGIQKTTWTYSDQAGAWYHHRFYDFEPDLAIANPDVREELVKIVSFWERLGVSGFRIDAAPFMIECTEPGGDPEHRDFSVLTELRERVSWRRGDVVFLAEANVPNEDLVQFFGDADGAANRLQMLFAFRLNEALMLSLARQDSTAVARALAALPRLPRHGQWATFLRNHDEVDLSHLPESERETVFAAFGPERRHQLYGRGIRRRLATMLGGSRRRLRMAYSLQFTMPGTPVLRYGDEIGMGEDLRLPERDAIRTPMQWSATANAGFSTAAAQDLVRPVIGEGPHSYEEVNVTDQRRVPDSLLMWFERMLHTRHECGEIGVGDHQVLHVQPAHVFAHRADAPGGSIVFLHNLSDRPTRISLPVRPAGDSPPVEVFSDREYPGLDLCDLELDGFGYRWIRLRRSHLRR